MSSLVNELVVDKVLFSAWKNVDVVVKKDKEEAFKKPKVISTEQSKTDFVSCFLKEFVDFKDHVARIKN